MQSAVNSSSVCENEYLAYAPLFPDMRHFPPVQVLGVLQWTIVPECDTRVVLQRERAVLFQLNADRDLAHSQ